MKIKKLIQSDFDRLLSYNDNCMQIFNSKYIRNYYIDNDININKEDYKNEIVRIFIKERKNKIYMHLLKHRDKIKNND